MTSGTAIVYMVEVNAVTTTEESRIPNWICNLTRKFISRDQNGPVHEVVGVKALYSYVFYIFYLCCRPTSPQAI